MDLEAIRKEIDHMRRQVERQRKDIRRLQDAGIDTTSADALLARMQDKVLGLCLRRENCCGRRARISRTNKVISGTPARRRA